MPTLNWADFAPVSKSCLSVYVNSRLQLARILIKSYLRSDCTIPQLHTPTLLSPLGNKRWECALSLSLRLRQRNRIARRFNPLTFTAGRDCNRANINSLCATKITNCPGLDTTNANAVRIIAHISCVNARRKAKYLWQRRERGREWLYCYRVAKEGSAQSTPAPGI
jgi:hypothetical protein